MVVHSILYYHHESLTDSALLELVSVVYELCLRLANRFDYVTGKLYLIYLLLLRHQMIRVTAILERLSLLDEIYQLIYGNHNAYRFEYDVPIFVSSQLAILTHHIDYGKQL